MMRLPTIAAFLAAVLVVAPVIAPPATAAEISDEAFEKRCRDAVLDLHVFFEEWLNARIPESLESMKRFRGVLADDFEYIGSAGFKLPKKDHFTDGLWPGHGYWLEDGRQGGATRVEKLEFRRISDTTAILTWEYWQDTVEKDGEKKSRGRLDTGIFRLDESMPHGVVWLHVQETLLPGMAPR